MKMPDGGFRPAYNVQFATATASQVIVGVEVETTGSDAGQMGPMADQVDDAVRGRPAGVAGRWRLRRARSDRRDEHTGAGLHGVCPGAQAQGPEGGPLPAKAQRQ